MADNYQELEKQINTLRNQAKISAQQESFFQKAYARAQRENGGQQPSMGQVLFGHLRIIEEITNSFIESKGPSYVVKQIPLSDDQANQIFQYCQKANSNEKTVSYGATGAALGASLFGWWGLIGGAIAGAAAGSNSTKNDRTYFLTLLNGAIDSFFNSLLYNNQMLYAQISHKNPQDSIEKPGIRKTSTDGPAKKSDPEEELNSLIGLSTIKRQVLMMKASLQKQQYANNKINLHMVFYGNPGTGKTEVARLIGRILHKAGILKTDKFVETDRSGLCGEYLGQTAIKTHSLFQEAMDGVLFIDEAYQLNGEQEGDMYGKEAIAALIKDMEDYRDRVCVILAGYKAPMEKMIAVNPGFKSRINRYIDFPNYSRDEIEQIVKLMAKKSKYILDEKAFKMIVDVIMARANNEDFANAREARNVLDSIIEIQAFRTQSNLSDMTILPIDVEEYIRDHK